MRIPFERQILLFSVALNREYPVHSTGVCRVKGLCKVESGVRISQTGFSIHLREYSRRVLGSLLEGPPTLPGRLAARSIMLGPSIWGWYIINSRQVWISDNASRIASRWRHSEAVPGGSWNGRRDSGNGRPRKLRVANRHSEHGPKPVFRSHQRMLSTCSGGRRRCFLFLPTRSWNWKQSRRLERVASLRGGHLLSRLVLGAPGGLAFRRHAWRSQILLKTGAGLWSGVLVLKYAIGVPSSPVYLVGDESIAVASRLTDWI
ncbi:hypothetical protein Poly24_46210 [Rosistilla carotiformis]|uniref:Uncharacterized protein n=1 Tax=Rosistilla carotiformis TaxID=2528017 RepID=A0A518JZB7_9BACT|nr:hypothetical protein Poly24_46210 [Rosistilla carotiformis]